MIYPICEKGVLKRRNVSVDKSGVAIGTFKAEVCLECGEQIFGPKEAAKIGEKIFRKKIIGY